jgi:hypothetical protein
VLTTQLITLNLSQIKIIIINQFILKIYILVTVDTIFFIAYLLSC